MFIFHRFVFSVVIYLDSNEIHVSADADGEAVAVVTVAASAMFCVYTPLIIFIFRNQYLPYGFIVTSQQKLITGVYWNPCRCRQNGQFIYTVEYNNSK